MKHEDFIRDILKKRSQTFGINPPKDSPVREQDEASVEDINRFQEKIDRTMEKVIDIMSNACLVFAQEVIDGCMRESEPDIDPPEILDMVSGQLEPGAVEMWVEFIQDSIVEKLTGD